MIDPSFDYRIDYDGRAIVLSGDTKKVQPVIDGAKGVEFLVHSIGAAREEVLESAPIWRLIMDHHVEPEDAGTVFAEARPKLAVCTHMVAPTNGKIPPVGANEIMERARTTYDAAGHGTGS